MQIIHEVESIGGAPDGFQWMYFLFYPHVRILYITSMTPLPSTWPHTETKCVLCLTFSSN